jgi:UbiD family decarboxylase
VTNNVQPPSFSKSQDLHEFVPAYADAFPEDVLQFSDPVSAIEDITAVVWELARQSRDELLVFNNVDDLAVDVVTNMFASRRRIARLVGAELADLHAAYDAKARNLLEPRTLTDGPVLERVAEAGEVDLTALPLLTHFSSDKAPYITSGVVIVEDSSGAGNMSYHRAMVNSPTTLATSLHSRGHLWRRMMTAAEEGKELPVALVIGGHPLFLLAASARVPADVDERHVAGGLMGAPLDVVRTPLLGFRVPATADFVLEGFIDPKLEVEEGPFGEFTGYSSDRSTHTLMRVETVLQRTHPMLADVVGGNSAEHLNLSRIPRESEMAQKLKDRFPSVTSVHYPNSGTHFHCYVSVRQRRPGEARQVMLGLLGWDPYLKTVIAVDDDVDITNDQEVLWALATRFQPAQDLFMVDGLPGSALDPSSSSVGTTSRMGLDATRSQGFEGTRIQLSDSSMERARGLIARIAGR